MPKSLLHQLAGLPPDQQNAVIAGGLALLLHLWPIWTGLRDQGGVAERLIAARRTGLFGGRNYGRRADDVYHQKTAAFRQWHRQDAEEVLDVGPKEHSAVKFLTVATWVGVAIGCGIAYLNWNGTFVFGDNGGHSVAASDVVTGPLAAARGTPATMPMPAVQTPPGSAQVPAIPPSPAGAPIGSHIGRPVPNVHSVATPSLPAVQRPTELSDSTDDNGGISGPNEAVAQRANDGSFAFDAVVNGTHLRMLFDTGASVVGLRAEDAERLGIPVDRLNYSAKIKTANGTADVAPITIDSMMVGNITLRKVSGFVAKEGMLHENLLGQTFLARLSGFNVEKNLLVLRGR